MFATSFLSFTFLSYLSYLIAEKRFEVIKERDFWLVIIAFLSCITLANLLID